MGISTRATLGAALGTTAVLGYLRSTTAVASPLPLSDAIFGSSAYRKYNSHSNPATNDICTKQIPLDRIRPELLREDGALALEFCRGVWSGWGFEIQRRYLQRKWYGPETSSQLWSRQQLASSSYEPGTLLTDHFEVVDRTPSEVTIRCGDSPRNQGPRPSDGLFVISAKIDKEAGVANLGLKSCFFHSHEKVEGQSGPMPPWMDLLHQWYARIWMASGSSRIMR